jgi:hypothetical protein
MDEEDLQDKEALALLGFFHFPLIPFFPLDF